MERIIDLDHKVFFLINGVLTHPWLDHFFVAVTDFTKSTPFYILLPVVLFIIYRHYGLKGLGVLVGGLALSSLADFISAQLLKEFFSRLRPEFASLPFEVILRRPSEGSFSLPSSHALDGFTLASFILIFSRSWGYWALLLALLVAYSRVYVGLHFPSDILIGAFLGTLFGIGSALVIRRYFIDATER